jgi:hypothetical protein
MARAVRCREKARDDWEHNGVEAMIAQDAADDNSPAVIEAIATKAAAG